MTFLAPLFLLGGLAVAAPVIFHLVRRSSREKQVFSSLMFLKPTPPRMTRRNRLENLFLLLLRCLVIALLALGFARPFFQKPVAAAPATSTAAQIVLLVDTSASMKRDGLWEDAIKQAEAELRKTSPADQVAILAFDEQVRTIIGFEQWTAMNSSERIAFASQQLAASAPTWRATHLGNALIAAAEIIEDAEKREAHVGTRRIVLISDLQDGSRLDSLQGHEWPRGLEVVVAPVKSRRPTNASLHWVLDTDDYTRAQGDVPIRLRVSNAADSTREQFQIRWTGANAASLDAYVPPGQSRMISVPELATNVTAHQLTLSGDDDSFDNNIYVVPPRAEVVNVLYLGNESESDSTQSLYYLQRAFQDTRRQAVRLARRSPDRRDDNVAMEASRSGDRRTASPRLAIVTSPLSEDRSNEMRQFLTNGGTALLVMNDASMATPLGALINNPSLVATEASVGNYAMFGAMDFTHPLLAPFADPRFGDFTKIRFWSHRTLNINQLPNARVIASYDSNDPAILELPVGSGRLFVFTFSWRPTESQFALSSKFVPLLYSLLDQASSSGAQLTHYRVGDIVPLTALASSNGASLSVRKPDGSLIELNATDSRFTDTDIPGIYEIIGATEPIRWAVNLDASESKTAPLPADELERLGVPMKTPEITTGALIAKQEHLHNVELEARQKLWRWLIVAALTVLLVETWLAGWLTRRSARPVETTA